MIRSIKYLILVAVLIFSAVSCSEDDKLTLEVQDTVPRGAILRTVSVEGSAWDVLDPDASITIEIEEQDEEDGGLLSELAVFVDLVDNTQDAITDPQEVQILTVPAADFETGPFGLPRASITLTQTEVASALGISLGDYNCGDQWSVRMDLRLTDGRSFTLGDAVGTVTGGSFFSSPYVYNISLVAPLSSDDLYTGQYQLTTLTPGIFGLVDFADGEYTLESVNNTTKVIKNLQAFPAIPGAVLDLEFQFVCGEIILTPGQNMGVGCNGTVFNGPASINSTYDLANPDDSQFVINFTSDEGDDCGTGTVQASIRLTKI